MINVRRIYEPPSEREGTRFLVDQLWPRGMKKEEVNVSGWLKDVSPSKELRQWFGHEPAKWNEFQRRYFAELDQKPETWRPLLEAARKGEVTLLFSARDQQHNNAVALKSYLEKRLNKQKARPRKPALAPA